MPLLTGETLAVDLVNTVVSTPEGEVDQLASPPGLAAWLQAEATRLDVVPPDPRGADVAAVQALRGHVRDAIDAARHGHIPPAAAVSAINLAARAAPAAVALVVDEGGVAVVGRRAGTPRVQLLAQLAEAAIDLLASPRVRDIRTCDGPACRMIFIPAHPRRRWCSPELCGNRVRVARYYQRHKPTG